jgi:UDPglucose--hexose-1-phosphate uridylyltransferase
MSDKQDSFEPELRRDPTTGIWVVIANRSGRPSGETEREKILPASACPFCPMKETTTPPEIYAVRPGGGEPNSPGWDLRVVPNKFRAFDADLPVKRQGIGMYDYMTACGAHEVIIETPEHDAQLRSMPVEQLGLILDSYRMRLVDLRKDPRFRHIIIFRNYRVVAGASLPHPHSQVIATPVVPKLVKDKLTMARAHFQERERCLFCDIVAQETYDGRRVVSQNESFLALVPFAARFPYEVHIFPKRHQHDFVLMTEEEKWGLVEILQDSLSRYYALLGDHEIGWNVPYNMVLGTAPNTLPRPGRPDYWGTIEYDYHWHIELIPRLTKMAGFEWGTGFYINVVLPERAASDLAHAHEIASEKQSVA